MARINAGSTLVNQYAPPFVVSDSVANGWVLSWNESLKAFEAVDPSATVTEEGFSTIESISFFSTRNQTYVVPWVADNKQSLIITINGVKQQQDAYTVTTNPNSGTTTITLSEPLDSGSFPTAPDVEILGLQAEGGASVLVYQETTSDNAQVLFPEPANSTIGWYPPSPASLIITIDGEKQLTGSYSIVPNASFTGAQIQFDTPPSDGTPATVEIVGITTTGETIASPVVTANLGTGAVENLVPLVGETTSAKSVSGNTQILNFKSLTAGTNVTLSSVAGDTAIEISADQPTFAQAGGGTSLIEGLVTDDPLTFRRITGANGVAVSAAGGTITVSSTDTYLQATGTTPTIGADDRLVGFEGSATGPVTATLPAIGGFYNGERITLKDESGNAGTNNITISTAGVELIDGQATYTISTDYGYVTLYSDGLNFFVISEG